MCISPASERPGCSEQSPDQGETCSALHWGPAFVAVLALLFSVLGCPSASAADWTQHVTRLANGTRSERIEAAKALAIREKGPARALVQALDQEISPDVRAEIVASLGKAVKDTRLKADKVITLDVQQEVFNALLLAMQDEDRRVKLACMRAVRGMCSHGIRLFEHPERLHERLVIVLRDGDHEVGGTALGLLADRWDMLTRVQEEQFLARHDPQLGRHLIVCLDSDDAATRSNAIGILCAIRERSCIPKLMGLLRAGQSVGAVASALSRLRVLEAVPELMAVTDRPISTDEEAQVIAALGALRDGRAVELLVKKTKSGPPVVRLKALYALTEFSDERAVAALTQAFESALGFTPFFYGSDWKRQRENFIARAGRYLGRTGTPEAMAALAKGLAYPRARLRGRIVGCIEDGDRESAIGIFTKALRTERNDRVREDMIRALTRLRSKEALPLLRTLLALEDREWAHRDKSRPRTTFPTVRWRKPDPHRKLDLSKLPSRRGGYNVMFPDSYDDHDYYLGDAIRKAIREIEG